MFKPEDGTGLPDATSYVSVEDADSYFTLRGNSAWLDLTLEQKQSSLVQATDYLDSVFGTRFIGVKSKTDQALEWPRKEQCGNSSVILYPRDLIRACCEYAVIASASPLIVNPEYDSSGRLPTLKREKLDVLEEETRWNVPNGFQEPQLIRPYPSADRYTYKLLRTGSGYGKVLR
jgi:hypothetical protein